MPQAVAQRSVQETRERILREAESLFATKGFEGTSIRDLAQACRISNAALYYHFPSKEVLLVETLKAALAHLLQAVQRAAQQGGNLRQSLRRISQAYMETVQQKRSIVQLLLLGGRELTEEVTNIIGEYYQKVPGVVAQVVARGMSRGECRRRDPDLVAMTLLGILNGLLARQFWGGGRKPSPATLDAVLDFLFEGLAGP